MNRPRPDGSSEFNGSPAAAAGELCEEGAAAAPTEDCMRYWPSYEEFVELARHASLVPVYRQLVGDTLTPVTAFCKIQEGEWAFLFESVVGGERVGRYSFVGSGPFLRFQAHDRRVQIQFSIPGIDTPGLKNSAVATEELEVARTRAARRPVEIGH